MAPISEGQDLAEVIEGYINMHRIMIFSKSTCPFCNQVKSLFKTLGADYFSLELNEIENGSQIQSAMAKKVGRSTVPQVFISGEHIGGCDDTMAVHNSGKLKDKLFPKKENYDFDLIVIGGGSGGLAASKEASTLGKKVAVLDFVTPTPKGTTWGLGGTCVNVGCIPKKLMHQAALMAQGIKDARKCGWEVPDVSHSWPAMRNAIQDHISTLNWNYKVQLRTAAVKYVNAHGKFIGPHKIKTVDKKGKESILTADNFIIATGGRPRYPLDCEGAKEYAITSDDLFSLTESPGKTLVVGASYVALECAGFLRGLGLDVTVMVRSILLRGFDQEMAEEIGKYMQCEGIKFLRPCIPKKIEQVEPGPPQTLKVTAQMESGETITDEYNTVLFAVGRDACTGNIGLDEIGVQVNPKNGKIPVTDEQTNVPYVYAIGDVLEGKPELTPVAIQAGMLLARRLYAKEKYGDCKCDYTCVPTTVFTPLEYGSIGYSEEDADAKYGEDVVVYISIFTPLEWQVAKRTETENVCYAKIICLKSEQERIIGFHYLGPNAGEVTQGFALGMKKGATKADLDATIGIHPTCAEIFTTLTVTRDSGKSAAQTGC